MIDMTPDGRFVEQPASGVPLQARVIGVAALVAVVAGAIGIALLALWLAMTLIPIAIGAGLVAYGVFRFRVWRARQNALGRPGNQVRR